MGNFYLGIDIGGTSVRAASFDVDSRLITGITKVHFKKFATAKEEVDANVCRLIENLGCSHSHVMGYGETPHSAADNSIGMKATGKGHLSGIGLSTAALFDRNTGAITDWPNNKLWNAFPLKKYLTERYQTEIVLEDDANSAALGEYLYGAGQGCDHFAYITVSTGIGCGLILNGNLYIGKNGWAGEIGHIRVSDDGPLCNCGEYGCLQAYASGPALLKRARELSLAHGISIRDLNDAAMLADQGAAWSRTVFEEAGDRIARMIIKLLKLLDIPVVILGGGVMESGDIILDPIKKFLRLYQKNTTGNIEIRPSLLGDSNCLMGVLNLAHQAVSNEMLPDIKNILNYQKHQERKQWND